VKSAKGLLVLSLAANLWLVYHVIDASSALADANSEADHRHRHGMECMAVLRLDWLGRREADVLALPQRLKAHGIPEQDLFIKREGDAVSVLGISFRVVEGKVREADFYGDADFLDSSVEPVPPARR
jgi:hypothetical protein